jgi:hypothetical protein
MTAPSVQNANAPARDPQRPSDRTDGPPWRAADFQLALRRASETLAEDVVQAPLGQTPIQRERLTFKADSEEAGKVDIVPGQADRTQAAPTVPAAAVQPGSPMDLAAFSAMLDKAWAVATPDGPKALQVRFLEQAWPMTGVQLVRQPDGALSVTLAASGLAVPQVSRTLEGLRKRLEARGLDIADLKLEAEDEPAAYAGRGR